MERAILHEAADVAHGLPKDPRAVHKPNLRGKQAISKEIRRESPWTAPEPAHAFWVAVWAASPETQLAMLDFKTLYRRVYKVKKPS